MSPRKGTSAHDEETRCAARAAAAALAHDHNAPGPALLATAFVLSGGARHAADVLRHALLLERAGRPHVAVRLLGAYQHGCGRTTHASAATPAPSSTGSTPRAQRTSLRRASLPQSSTAAESSSNKAATEMLSELRSRLLGHGALGPVELSIPHPDTMLPPGWSPGNASSGVGVMPCPNIDAVFSPAIEALSLLRDGMAEAASRLLNGASPALIELPAYAALRIACAYQLGDDAALFSLAHRLMAEEPAGALAWVAAGLHSLLAAKPDDARRQLVRATRLAESKGLKLPTHFAPIGQAHDAQSRLVESLALLALGNAHAAAGDHDPALAAYVRGLDVCAANEKNAPLPSLEVETRLALAAEHMRVRRPALARAYVDGLPADLPAADVERGAYLVALGDARGAAAFFERAAATLASRGAACSALGRAAAANLRAARLLSALHARDADALRFAASGAREAAQSGDFRLASLLAELGALADGAPPGAFAEAVRWARAACDSVHAVAAPGVGGTRRAAAAAAAALARVLERQHGCVL